MNTFKKLLAFIFAYMFESEVKAIKCVERNIRAAPACCNKPMEYLGEHSSMYSITQFYQCQECRRVELLHKNDWEK